MKKHIAVLFGGPGAETAVSARSCAAVLEALAATDYHCLPVGMNAKRALFVVSPFPTEAPEAWERSKSIRPARFVRSGDAVLLQTEKESFPLYAVLPVMHGDMGEDGRIQGFLEVLGVPYVGCDTGSGALCTDKGVCKLLAAAMGVPTLPQVLFTGKEPPCEAEATAKAVLGEGPLFIKPRCLGSSVGAGAVLQPGDFARAFAAAASYGPCMAEPYLYPVTEIEVGCADDGVLHIFPPATVQMRSAAFYSYEEKYSGQDAYIRHAPPLPEAIRAALRTYTKRLAEAFGIRDLSRFDYFYTDNALYFNEVNTFPGMGSTSLFPVMAEQAGMSLGSLLGSWIERAHARGI